MINKLKILKTHISKIFLNAKLRNRLAFEDVYVDHNVVVKGRSKKVSIGENTKFLSYAFIHLGGEEWCDYKGSLHIGKNCIFSPFVVLFCAGSEGIYIGDNLDCGPGVKIYSSITNKSNPNKHIFKGVKIGHNVVLYSNVVISAGVTISNNIVVGANSVVLSDLTRPGFYAGSPAVFKNAL